MGVLHCFHRANRDLVGLMLKVSEKVAYKIIVTGKSLANFISGLQCPCLLILHEL